MMGDDPAYWKEVVNKLKRDPRLTTVQKIEDGEEHEMWMWRETRIPGIITSVGGKIKKP